MFKIPNFIACVLLSVTLAMAQKHPIDINKVDIGDGATITASNSDYPLIYSVAIFAMTWENVKVDKVTFRTIRSRTPQALLTVKPIDDRKEYRFSPSFRFAWGDYRAKPDFNFVYRLPYSTTQNYKVTDHRPKSDTLKPEGWRMLLFTMQEGDTIYAARRGTVVNIPYQMHDSPTKHSPSPYWEKLCYIHIEHADGTMAKYGAMDRETLMVKHGDIVYPDTPLALVGELDEGLFQMDFSICYTQINLRNPDTNHSWGPFRSAFVNPIFTTSTGDVILESGKEYQPLVSQELVQKEMTRKELAKLNKKKKK